MSSRRSVRRPSEQQVEDFRSLFRVLNVHPEVLAGTLEVPISDVYDWLHGRKAVPRVVKKCLRAVFIGRLSLSELAQL